MNLRALIWIVLTGTAMTINNPNQEYDALLSKRGRPFQAQYEESLLKKPPNGELIYEAKQGHIYRDSRGRERIESHVEIKPGEIIGTATIYDPINGAIYTLNSESNIILHTQLLPNESEPSGFWAWTVGSQSAYAIPRAKPAIQPNTEPLQIEGLTCDGYSIIQPEGRKIEYWYSNDLNEILLLKSTSSDEKFTLRLFNIQHGEPDNELFKPIMK